MAATPGGSSGETWETELSQIDGTVSDQKVATLESVEFHPLTDTIQIILSLDRDVQFKTAELTDPERIYLDLFRTTVGETFSRPPRQIRDPLLRRIRVAQFQPGVTRVVLDLTERANYRVSPALGENRLIVELARRDLRRPPLPPAQARTSRSLAKVLDVQFEARADQTEVILSLSQPRQPTAQRLSSPPRLYFDVLESQVGRDLARNLDVGDARVRRIRVRQNRPDTVRLVLDLVSPVQYQTEWLEDLGRWVVRIAAKDLPTPVEEETPRIATGSPVKTIPVQPSLQILPLAASHRRQGLWFAPPVRFSLDPPRTSPARERTVPDVPPSKDRLPPPAEEVVAQVNGYFITVTELERETNLIRAELQERMSDPEELTEALQVGRRRLLQDMIERKTLLARAEQLGLAREVEMRTEAFLERFCKQTGIGGLEELDRILASHGSSLQDYRGLVRGRISADAVFEQEIAGNATVSDAEVLKFYEEHPEDFQAVDEIELAEIFLSTAVSDAARVRQRAADTLNRIRRGTPFETLAKSVSDGTTAQLGGRIGVFRKGMLDERREEIAFSLDVEEVSGVIAIPEGFQILKVLGKSYQPVAFEEVEADIRDKLQEVQLRSSVRSFLDRLLANSRILISPRFRSEFDLSVNAGTFQ